MVVVLAWWDRAELNDFPRCERSVHCANRWVFRFVVLDNLAAHSHPSVRCLSLAAPQMAVNDHNVFGTHRSRTTGCLPRIDRTIGASLPPLAQFSHEFLHVHALVGGEGLALLRKCAHRL
jgi:hypothetical protein